MLQNFDVQDFLQHYWQQAPLLIRQGLPGFECPLDGDDLAGLACEEDAESRLILGDRTHWQLRRGPFEENDFSTLPAQHWTLLVQRVDHWVPELAELCAAFRFLPRWRLEDIMVSYATDGGNVGPHFDQYDVFLVQGQGQRRWQLGGHCNHTSALLPHTDLSLMADFQATDEYLLEAGDILYIPPGVAHWGIAEGGDCITLSVGFRAPSQVEMLADFADHFASVDSQSRRYRDPAPSLGKPSGYIDRSAIAAVKSHLQAALSDEQQLSQWFGELMTRNAELNPPSQGLSAQQFSIALSNGLVSLQLGARLAFDERWLFADGHSYQLTTEDQNAVAAFCELEPGDLIDINALRAEQLFELYQAGTLVIEYTGH